MRSKLYAILLLLGGLVSRPASAQGNRQLVGRADTASQLISHCLTCHEGIEGINQAMNVRWRAHTDCMACHKGNPNGRTLEEAHAGLIPNPGDLRVVMDTCGTCHSEFGPGVGLTRGSARSVVDRVLRSSMALASGEIAAVRYLWGEQSSPAARFGVRSVAGLGETQPDGAIAAIAELPPAKNSLADHLLRTRCLQCHLWTAPEPSTPPYRGAGCAACHVPYAADGRSRSGDPTVSKTDTGHPEAHRIVRAVENAQCLTCHRGEGLGIGWNYIGWLSRPGDGRPVANPGPATAVPVPPDVHAAAGLACIDCHDTWDVHGDGHIYPRGRNAVGIRCVTCHGTPDAAPTFRTARGHPLSNIEFRDGVAVLMSKVSKVVRPIPRLDQPATAPGPAAHRIVPHFPGMGDGRNDACVACHAGEVRQPFMRRYELDRRQAVEHDWGVGLGTDSRPRVTAGRWTVQDTWSPVGLPMIGMTATNRLAPLVPNFHTVRYVIDEAGRSTERGRLLETQDGRYGVGFRTVDPHRTQRTGRSCASCHADPAALGLGSSRIDSTRLGWPLRYAPDQAADDEGTPIAAFSTPGERPLNHDQLVNVVRTVVNGDAPTPAPPPATPHPGPPPDAPTPPDNAPVLSPFIGR